MKISNVEIRVKRGISKMVQAKVKIISQDQSTDTNKLRRVCARILSAASRKGSSSTAFEVFGSAASVMPVVATAKIMAQEVFRHIRESKHPVREVVFVTASDKIFKVFKPTVENYLKHIALKICQGPFVTVDVIIEVQGGIVLIKRSNPPFGWAIPGGFVDYGESLEAAAIREAKEETSLVIKNLRQLHTYSAPGRDPRFHTVSTVFICQAKGRPKGGSDASEAHVFQLKNLKNIKLAFDHGKILQDYLQYRRQR